MCPQSSLLSFRLHIFSQALGHSRNASPSPRLEWEMVSSHAWLRACGDRGQRGVPLDEWGART